MNLSGHRIVPRGRWSVSGLAATVLFSATTLLAAGPVQVTLSAKGKRVDDTKTTSQRVGDSRYEQQTTTYTETGSSALDLAISLRNMGREAQNLKLEWYFVGKPLDSKMPDFVADKGTLDLALAPASGTNHVVRSKSIKLMKQTGQNLRVREGAEVAGYLVLAKVADTVVAMDASSPSLKKIVADGRKWKEFLATPPPGDPEKKK